MEAIARELRRISPTSLVDDFERRVDAALADVVINDDVRDPFVDAPRLRSHGFTFIRIVCEDRVRRRRLGLRGDVTTVEHSSTTAGLDLIDADAVIENSDDGYAGLRERVHGLLRSYL